MARRCEICGKGTVAGNSVPRKGQAKKHGGVGQHIGVTTKRVFRPNIVSVKTLVKGLPVPLKYAHVACGAVRSRSSYNHTYVISITRRAQHWALFFV